MKAAKDMVAIYKAVRFRCLSVALKSAPVGTNWKSIKTLKVDNFVLESPIEAFFFFKLHNFWRQMGWSSSEGAWGGFLTLNFEFFLYFDTFLRLRFLNP